jgi:UDP:flavonoid glycosyltransferase YjiC (YdhE family)
MLALGCELLERGHEVGIETWKRWREPAEAAGMTFAAAPEYLVFPTREQLWTPKGAPAEHFYQARGWRRTGRRDWNPWVALEMVGYARDLV